MSEHIELEDEVAGLLREGVLIDRYSLSFEGERPDALLCFVVYGGQPLPRLEAVVSERLTGVVLIVDKVQSATIRAIDLRHFLPFLARCLEK